MEASRHLFIVGAGFSFNAGLPLASNFTEALLDPKAKLTPGYTSHTLNEVIRAFIDDAFGNGVAVPAIDWPELEDVFTTIDLAANTGHHLGPKYPASTLRTIRRSLIVRFMRMLRTAYDDGARRKSAEWQLLQDLLGSVDLGSGAFLSLNWDTVIESGLARLQRVTSIDYACGALPAKIERSGIQVRRVAPSATMARILKPHGSINWMYCDCCSRMYWFAHEAIEKVASRLFKDSDKAVVKALTGIEMRNAFTSSPCPECKAEALGTRFATFSYRKALEFPMHIATWREAERQLREAEDWIFIGYSLPPADYEFKFLLKRVQLSRTKPPRITLVTSGGPASPTAKAYRKFFGASAIRDSDMFVNGLNLASLDHLRKVRALT
ncbi:hypothetical protein SAMN05216382_2679 [Sphingomonas palmae]|uniref:Deacetylase sirtuin-type domain-containing protein n=1 Tax=Sphingomonas palmae TaxID=1855283 RepID=A0A1H7T609_9SPHN|nr:hypothetical protein [Sphingomonas palmae]SEL80281.1 hypothetical protein SAMN05216382_2679 [Sphingomonas palmae]